MLSQRCQVIVLQMFFLTVAQGAAHTIRFLFEDFPLSDFLTDVVLVWLSFSVFFEDDFICIFFLLTAAPKRGSYNYIPF